MTVRVILPDGSVHPLPGAGTLFQNIGGLAYGSAAYTIRIADAPDGGCGVPGPFSAIIRVQGVLNDSPDGDDTFTSDTPLTFTPEPAQPHFLCDVTRNGGIAPGTVPVVDQFGAMSAKLGRMRRLCNPANINNDDPVGAATPTHLDGYSATIRKPPAAHKRILVTDRFGAQIETIGGARNVLVPAAKSLIGPPAPLGTPDVDHFVCYQVMSTSYKRSFLNIVNDEFGEYVISALKPVEFCYAANVNDTAPGAEAHVLHYSCWSVGLAPGSKLTQNSQVWVNDDFQDRQVTVTKLSEICVPAAVQLFP